MPVRLFTRLPGIGFVRGGQVRMAGRYLSVLYDFIRNNLLLVFFKITKGNYTKRDKNA